MANELIHSSVGTSLTQAEFEAVGLHVLNSQATGDLIYASSASQLTRLGIGSSTQVLIVTSGIPAWSSTLGCTTVTATGFVSDSKVIHSSGAFAFQELTTLSTTGVTLTMTGGTTVDNGGAVRVHSAGDGGTVEFYTPNAAGTGAVKRLTIPAIADTTGTVAWTNINAMTFDQAVTIALTGTRIAQSYHTNLTSTNAVTVDSSLLSKVPESIHPYEGDALGIIGGIRVVDYRHYDYLDASNRTKLGIIAESVNEPLALNDIENPKGGVYPGVNMMGLLALQTKAIQELTHKVELLETR